jgi:exodeoxyribonuclease VII large subunit
MSSKNPTREQPPAQAQLSFELRGRVAPPPAPAAEPPPDLWDRGEPNEAEPEAQPISAPASGQPPAGDTQLAPKEPRIFGVGELVRAARLMLEARFADVRVEGEISGLKRSGQGHLYFSLKDGEGSIDCVMFSREATRLKWSPAEGQLVRCRGRLTIFEGRGKFQMTVSAMEPAGAGLLALAFEELKRKLAAEGLFAPERKRPLPFLPRRIGLVTSQSGAVLRDIIRVAHRRAAVPLLLSPTPVQGEGAARSIVAALRLVASVPDVDVVIVARGGGSLEDLWCFNDEGLARAIAACRVPVISAVGHETDFTIADFVADLRAPTPSAAAEMAVPVAAELHTELAVLKRRLARGVLGDIRNCTLALERARSRLGDPRRLVDERRQLLDDLMARGAHALRTTVARRRQALRAEEARLFRAHPQRRIAEQRRALQGLEHRLVVASRTGLASRRRLLHGLLGKLESLSPLAVLDRGYSLARRPDGHVITQRAELRPGDQVQLRFRDGEVRTRVEPGQPGQPGEPGEPGEQGEQGKDAGSSDEENR